jgi:hypothetical protein
MADAGEAAFDVGAVESSAATTGAEQFGELEEVGLDAFEPLVGKLWEAGKHALYPDACLRCVDERFGNAPAGLISMHQAAKSAVAIVVPKVPL